MHTIADVAAATFSQRPPPQLLNNMHWDFSILSWDDSGQHPEHIYSELSLTV